jgi:hypothetical protein
MKPILLSLNLIMFWFGTTAYAGVLWALHFFWFPTWRTLRVENYYDQFIPQTTAATRFFTVVVSLMFLSLIIIIVHEWRTRLKWPALAAFLTLGAATFFGTLRILPINHKLKEGVTDQAQLTEMLNRWINLNETRFVLLTLLWIILVYYIFRKGRLGAAMNE